MCTDVSQHGAYPAGHPSRNQLLADSKDTPITTPDTLISQVTQPELDALEADRQLKVEEMESLMMEKLQVSTASCGHTQAMPCSMQAEQQQENLEDMQKAIESLAAQISLDSDLISMAHQGKQADAFVTENKEGMVVVEEAEAAAEEAEVEAAGEAAEVAEDPLEAEPYLFVNGVLSQSDDESEDLEGSRWVSPKHHSIGPVHTSSQKQEKSSTAVPTTAEPKSKSTPTVGDDEGTQVRAGFEDGEGNVDKQFMKQLVQPGIRLLNEVLACALSFRRRCTSCC